MLKQLVKDYIDLLILFTSLYVESTYYESIRCYVENTLIICFFKAVELSFHF